jgi:hypothetical protein
MGNNSRSRLLRRLLLHIETERRRGFCNFDSDVRDDREKTYLSGFYETAVEFKGILVFLYS